MGKVLACILGTLVIGILVVFLLFRFGVIGFGTGSGNGNGDVESEMAEETPVIEDEAEEITITIVVTQDQYMIDEQIVTLTQIRKKVADESAEINVVLEDNYASAKAWDEIKTSLAEWGVIPIEQ